jgi:release factor glutamine methyltransferase
VLGYGEFYGRKFKCDGRALVPRPETEELVDWIINDWATINSRQLPINVLDIGTGTGCIALSLAKELEGAKITAVDISTAALSLARENAEILEAKDVRFIECDILGDCNVIEEGYDVIVSNPPYVRECEKKEMEANVLDYDPHTALFVSDEDPLVFYRAIAEFALTHLTPNGALYFEINQYLGRETCDLLVAMGYRNVELRDDINGNARMVRATL